MTTRKIIILLGLLCLAGLAAAMGSPGYDLSWNTLSSGGGETSSAHYRMDGTIGQLGGTSSSTSYRLEGGFWIGNGFPPGDSIPTITTLTPSSVFDHAAAFKLAIKGTNFTKNSSVLWDGEQRETWYISRTQLKANISAGDLIAAKKVNISIKNSGQLSANTTFTIKNRIPSATTLSPAIIPNKNNNTNVTIIGKYFNTQSIVYWNGAAIAWPSSCINGTRMNFTVPSTFLTQPVGTSVKVQVFNPAPGGGKSVNLTLKIGQPVPNITSLDPEAGFVGMTGVALHLNGTNFAAGAKVLWNGVTKQPKAVNITPTEIILWIPQTDLVIGKDNFVSVKNPVPGSPVSNQITFPIKNPVPEIISISPLLVKAGGMGFTLTVNGNNFTKTSRVCWNGAEKVTKYINPTRLTVTITTADINAPGDVPITVHNPAPGGGVSSSLPINVTNPSPIISNLQPPMKVHGSAAFNLSVKGTNFTALSTVQWNGMNRTTYFISGSFLKASIDVADIASTGTSQVGVLNPAATGDLLSPPRDFTVT